jgi:hypothetical protein
VLQQLNGGSWQPLVFYSKKLSGAGTRYSTFDRELLATFSAVRHFRFLLEGRQFHLLTNHKPLVTSDWHDHLPWVMLGIRASFREDNEFFPAEAVFGSQLVLPGQFVDTAESPSPSFLNDLRTAMTSRPPPPTRHNSVPAPSTLDGRAAADPLHTCPPRRCAAAAVPDLRRTLPSAGAFLSPRDRR